jgi:hypothetical protein
MLNIIKNTINRVFASGVDSDASAFITATGLSGTTQKSAITTLVKDLKSSGLWSKMKAVYPMVTDNRNLLSYTEDFTNAAWTQTNVSVSANSTTAPNSTLTADTLTEAASSTTHILKTTDIISFTTGITYTYSIYAKNTVGGRGLVQLAAYQIATGNTDAYCNFNLANGTIGANANCTYSIQDVGNGWYRCTITATSTKTYLDRYNVILIDNINASSFPSYLGDVSKSIYIWGAQFEIGALSTYQPILTTPSAYMASQMKYNLKDARDLDAAFRLTWSGGWTYSATGATPNGTNAYADTKLSPSTSLSLNSTHISYYSRTQSNGTEVEIGSANTGGVNGSLIEIRTSGVTYYRVNSGITFLTYTDSDSRSFYIANRTASNIVNGWRNSSKVVSGTTASSSLNSENYYLGALNQANSALYFSTKQASFASIGDGLSDSDAQLLNQIVEKYQVALSRGVQAAQSFYYNSAYSNEANTYLYSTQITGTTQVSAINTLINGLKANNLWTKMKAVYPFVTDKWNLFSFTEDLTNVAWSKSNVSATLTGTFLGNNVYKLADTTNTNVVHLIAQGPMVVSNTYTVSVNFKKAEYDYAQIFEGGAVFNLANGTVQSALGSNATMVDLGDGWYRCSVTVVAGAANIHIAANKTATSGYAYLSTIGYGIFMSAPQIQYGTIASPYQVISGTNSNTINQTAVAAQMKFNLVNPQDTDAAFRLAFSGGWTYSTNGAQPNGTNGFANTYALIPSQNSGSLGFYSRTNSVAASCSFGGTTVQSGLFLTYLPNQSFLRINDAGSSGAISTTDSFGLFIANRVSGTETRNLVKGAIVAQSANSIGTQTVPNYIGALNQNGSGSLYDNKQCAFAFVADGFSDAELLLLNTLINSYQTTLSRNV